MGRTRGRRPGSASGAGDGGTREEILEEARRQFSEVGYPRTSLRSIARAAGIDPRLILHYFGSKQQLFIATIDLPFEPEVAFDRIFAAGMAQIGARFADFMLSVLEDPRTQRSVTGIVRAAVSEPEAAALVRDLLTERLLTPMARRVGHDRPELRASLMGTQIIGLVMGRYVVGLDPLIGASHDDLVRALAPVLEHYLTGDWTSTPEGDG